ncbi:heavy metal-binding domain-containing protein [Weissella confusa]|uniref:heavy metal-binding domain-containing protein n=1 Tax=Weissella confusa TaxID=1583 RepID=UPI0035A330CF
MSEILITTTGNVAGYHVTKTHGEVFSLTTRSRNMFSTMGHVLGAKAVIMIRFDSSSANIGDSVAAYDTAVTIEKEI